ncbi:MAG: TIGR01459 family HAD-type hydrolase [Hyphomicrobiales bacterium]|nr:TIGR01459 family HAD-type hydrolase [Hyphomicrobiales bacterium]
MTLSTPDQPIPILDSISSLARRYDVWLTDIWGVMHNGLQPFPRAVEACRLFRQGGGAVILISNSPRPAETARIQLREVGVVDDSYDSIATSGDVTRQMISAYRGKTIFHLGPERDLPIYDDLGVTIGPLEESALVVCSGLFNDETETPGDYAELLADLRKHKLPMLCANPDLMVERGNRLIYCAGSIAKAYAEIGGETIYGGKPHAPIYQLAFRQAATRKSGITRQRMLAIGDGLHTDIPGAAAAGVDSVFIASAVHVPGGSEGLMDGSVLNDLLVGIDARPVAAMKGLAW